jgi:hypothetical protein
MVMLSPDTQSPSPWTGDLIRNDDIHIRLLVDQSKGALDGSKGCAKDVALAGEGSGDDVISPYPNIQCACVWGDQ